MIIKQTTIHSLIHLISFLGVVLLSFLFSSHSLPILSPMNYYYTFHISYLILTANSRQQIIIMQVQRSYCMYNTVYLMIFTSTSPSASHLPSSRYNNLVKYFFIFASTWCVYKSECNKRSFNAMQSKQYPMHYQCYSVYSIIDHPILACSDFFFILLH